jgi:hypothetical protein
MARKAKSPEIAALSAATGIDAEVLEVVAATPEVVTAVANPFAALVAEQPAPAAVGVKAKAAAVIAKLGAETANSVGVTLASVAPSIAAKGVAVGAYPVAVVALSYTLGAKLANGACPARGVHDRAVVAKIHSLQASVMTGAQLQEAGVPWHSMAEYLKRGWLTKA